MNEGPLIRVLPLMFREVKIPEHAKEDLRRRLFRRTELSDDDLTLVSAAGDITEQVKKQAKNQIIEEEKSQ